jgi:hypothetical protein
MQHYALAWTRAFHSNHRLAALASARAWVCQECSPMDSRRYHRHRRTTERPCRRD